MHGREVRGAREVPGGTQLPTWRLAGCARCSPEHACLPACSESLFAGNSVALELQGVGGGLYLAHPNFSVAASQLAANTAFFGGGLFLAANLSRGASLAQLSLAGNVAQGMGSAAYW